MKPIWEAAEISKGYSLGRGMGKKKKVQALRGVSLSVAAGEIVALVGESGSGKSTLARLALALEEPDSGAFRFQEKSYGDWGDRKALYRRIQMVFQSTSEAADPAWKAREVIAEPLVHLTPLTPGERKDRVEAAAAQARFPMDCLHKPIAALSGGQRQRACIARALSVKPEFLVLDEPTSGLDAPLQEQILSLLEDLARTLSVSMLLITHDLQAAIRYAGRIAFLSEGVLVETADSEALAKLKHPYARMLYEASL
jgi:ABC-type glutathione transport system ATPase component